MLSLHSSYKQTRKSTKNYRFNPRTIVTVPRYVKYQNAPEGQNTENTTYDDAYITDEYNGKNTGIEWVTANGDCIHSLTPQNENGTSWEYGCGALGGGFFGTVTLQK